MLGRTGRFTDKSRTLQDGTLESCSPEFHGQEWKENGRWEWESFHGHVQETAVGRRETTSQKKTLPKESTR